VVHDSWAEPDEIIDESGARALVATASIVAGSAEGPMTTPEELELWVKHLGPVWRTDMAAMKEALAACYREAAAAGVLRGDAKPAWMSDFLDLPRQQPYS